MKNKKWIYGILMASLIFLVYSCTYYKTVALEDVSEQTVSALMKQKKIITLNQVNNSKTFTLSNPSLENGMLKGELINTNQNDHPDNKNTFRRSNGKDALNYLHLTTSKDIKTAGPIEIPISELSSIVTHEGDFPTSFIATSGVIIATGAVAAAAGLGVLLLICACPHVATINPDGTAEMQGSLFPGSIFKPLKRKDYLVLNNVNPNKDNILEVKISNDLEEVQYIDQVQLYSVQHLQKHLGLNSNSQLIAFNEGESPREAKSQIGRNVLDELTLRDNATYDFDDPPFDLALNSIEMTFNVSELNNDALLIIRGKQTQLLEQTADVFFQQFGTKFPKWVEKMNEVNPDNYNKNSLDQGISLNVYVKKENKWNYLGNYENVGSMSNRDLAIPIDLTSTDSEIEIKMETAYGFWSLDQVTLTSDWNSDLKKEALNLVSAINQDNQNVFESASLNDENYVVQAEKGTYTNLKFDVSTIKNRSFVLSGSGYYNHTRSYENEPNNKALRKMNRNKFATHQMAQMIQFYNDIHVASNN